MLRALYRWVPENKHDTNKNSQECFFTKELVINSRSKTVVHCIFEVYCAVPIMVDDIAVSQIQQRLLAATQQSAKMVEVTTMTTGRTNTISPLEEPYLLQYIMNFVGDYNYWFVATVNCNFRAAYTKVFPDTQTSYNATTIDHFRLCYKEYLNTNNIETQRWLICWAVRYGILEALQLFQSFNCSWDEDTCYLAVENSRLDMLQWAKANNFCLWKSQLCMKAASNGHLHILQWAREIGCEWDKSTCEAAAENGHLHILQWAVENSCPMNEYATLAAAKNGHLHVLIWANANDCPMYYGLCKIASGNGHLNVLQWAQENDFHWDGTTCAYAAYNGHLKYIAMG
jgi:hypothetical protein